jgi:hypothetical protein
MFQSVEKKQPRREEHSSCFDVNEAVNIKAE